MIGIKLLGVFLFLFQVTNALHFYLKTNEQRCFFEELPQETLVVAKVEAFEFDEHTKSYFTNKDIKLEYTISETFDKDHKVVNLRANYKGDIPFNSLGTGEHKFCIRPVYNDGTNNKKHRIFFDIAIGSAHEYIDSKSTNKVDQLTGRVNTLNQKLEQIIFEQEQIREREAIFRDQSESTNSRVVFWTIIQLAVLIGACFYQLKHLKSFFVKQKIV